MTVKIYGILDTETNKFCCFNSRVAWSSLSALQSSFHAGQKYWPKEQRLKWKEQTRFVAIELTEPYFILEDLHK